jgi:CRP/FNR family transcriptional regulator
MEKITEASSAHCNICLFKKQLLEFNGNYNNGLCLNHTTPLHFSRGENLIKQGSAYTHLIYLTHGMIKVFHKSENGKVAIITIAGPPLLVGCMGIFNSQYNQYSIAAVADSEACLIDANELRSLAREDKTLCFNLVKTQFPIYEDLLKEYINRSHKQVIGRVVSIIIHLARNVFHSNSFKIPVSRQEMAEYVQCSETNISHVLSELQEDGYIETDGKIITITDLQKLEIFSKVG